MWSGTLLLKGVVPGAASWASPGRLSGTQDLSLPFPTYGIRSPNNSDEHYSWRRTSMENPGQDQGQRHGAESLKLGRDEMGVRADQGHAGGGRGEGTGRSLSTPGDVRGCLHVLCVCGI